MVFLCDPASFTLWYGNDVKMLIQQAAEGSIVVLYLGNV